MRGAAEAAPLHARKARCDRGVGSWGAATAGRANADAVWCSRGAATEGLIMGTWIFQGKPEIWDVVAGVHQLEDANWGVRQYKNDIRAGDTAYIWVSGQNAGIVAVAPLTS